MIPAVIKLAPRHCGADKDLSSPILLGCVLLRSTAEWKVPVVEEDSRVSPLEFTMRWCWSGRHTHSRLLSAVGFEGGMPSRAVEGAEGRAFCSGYRVGKFLIVTLKSLMVFS